LLQAASFSDIRVNQSEFELSAEEVEFLHELNSALGVQPVDPVKAGLGIVKFKSTTNLYTVQGNTYGIDAFRPTFLATSTMRKKIGSTYCDLCTDKKGCTDYTYKDTKADKRLVVQLGAWDKVMKTNDFNVDTKEGTHFEWKPPDASKYDAKTLDDLLNGDPQATLQAKSLALSAEKKKIDDEAARIIAKAHKWCSTKFSVKKMPRKYAYICASGPIGKEYQKYNPSSYAAPLMFGVKGIDGYTNGMEVVMFGFIDSKYYAKKAWTDGMTLVSKKKC